MYWYLSMVSRRHLIELLIRSVIASPRLGVFFVGLTQALTMLSMPIELVSWNMIL
jgi:hypothetical protein